MGKYSRKINLSFFVSKKRKKKAKKKKQFSEKGKENDVLSL
jgi:hypothetical protein